MSRISALYLMLVFGLISCVSETKSTDIIFDNNPLKNQHLIHSFRNTEHLFELYSRDTVLYEGYNELLFRIKDNNSKYISYAKIDWELSSTDLEKAPNTEVKQSEDTPEIYSSFLIFPSKPLSKEWKLKINYKIQSTSYQIETALNIRQASPNRINMVERIGSDNIEYLFALSSPYSPINGFNNCELLVYKKENSSYSSSYSSSKDLNIKIWSSQNSITYDGIIDLTYKQNIDRYQARIELIDYGLWRLNLLVKDKNNQHLLGEEKNASTPESSLHFPLLVKMNK